MHLFNSLFIYSRTSENIEYYYPKHNNQPLWLKAVEIKKSKSINVVCRLEGFHLLMGFLKSIGKVMEYFGISELFQVVHSSDTSVYILLRRVYSRALQAHFLVQIAFNT